MSCTQRIESPCSVKVESHFRGYRRGDESLGVRHEERLRNAQMPRFKKGQHKTRKLAAETLSPIFAVAQIRAMGRLGLFVLGALLCSFHIQLGTADVHMKSMTEDSQCGVSLENGKGSHKFLVITKPSFPASFLNRTKIIPFDEDYAKSICDKYDAHLPMPNQRRFLKISPRQWLPV